MNELLLMYLITVILSMKYLYMGLLGMSGVYALVTLMCYEEECKWVYFRRPIIMMWVAVGLMMVVPDKDDILLIMGGAAVLTVANTEEARKLPDNVLRAMNTVLERVAPPQEATSE